jgi:hypothetical protein
MKLRKTISAIGFFLLFCSPAMAQQEEQLSERAGEKLQAMEVAYLTRELNLSPDDAQKFWPVFNKYRDEVRSVWGDRTLTDPLDRQQKVLNIRKQYRNDFSRLLSPDRSNRVFPAEDQFRQLVRREFIKRQMEKKELIGPRKRGN